MPRECRRTIGVATTAPTDRKRGTQMLGNIIHFATSRPKRVPLTHANLLESARNIARSYALTPDDVSLAVMPLFHVHGLVGSVLSTFASGGSVVVPPGFNRHAFWGQVRACRATWYCSGSSSRRTSLGW